MSDYIPLELQAEIIQKLPIKSLIQFRSVSKPWKSLIDSSKFIANYSVHHTDTQPQRILVRYDFPEDNDHNYVSIVDDDTFAQNMLDDNIPVLLTTIEDSILVGSSNGLLCFYGDSSSYYTSGAAMAVLWNPDSLANQHPGSLSVSSLRGSLVVLEYSINGGKRVCHVWKMEHGVPNLFMKLYTIHPVNESINKVFGFINSGAPVIKVEDGDDEDFEDCCVMVSLALYEPKSKQITAIGIYGTEDSVFLTCYKESLLLLDRPDGRLFNVNSDDDDDDESQSC